jgi:hypothetical protein
MKKLTAIGIILIISFTTTNSIIIDNLTARANSDYFKKGEKVIFDLEPTHDSKTLLLSINIEADTRLTITNLGYFYFGITCSETYQSVIKFTHKDLHIELWFDKPEGDEDPRETLLQIFSVFQQVKEGEKFDYDRAVAWQHDETDTSDIHDHEKVEEKEEIMFLE